mmetsp:Transcript_11128/g.23980  ORF Transcript_11128/g.23980 Transcript_11128/m.23980 type:complete len:1037 (-) Transcript_11128:432-3542(-)
MGVPAVAVLSRRQLLRPALLHLLPSCKRSSSFASSARKQVTLPRAAQAQPTTSPLAACGPDKALQLTKSVIETLRARNPNHKSVDPAGSHIRAAEARVVKCLEESLAHPPGVLDLQDCIKRLIDILQLHATFPPSSFPQYREALEHAALMLVKRSVPGLNTVPGTCAELDATAVERCGTALLPLQRQAQLEQAHVDAQLLKDLASALAAAPPQLGLGNGHGLRLAACRAVLVYTAVEACRALLYSPAAGSHSKHIRSVLQEQAGVLNSVIQTHTHVMNSGRASKVTTAAEQGLVLACSLVRASFTSLSTALHVDHAHEPIQRAATTLPEVQRVLKLSSGSVLDMTVAVLPHMMNDAAQMRESDEVVEAGWWGQLVDGIPYKTQAFARRWPELCNQLERQIQLQNQVPSALAAAAAPTDPSLAGTSALRVTAAGHMSTSTSRGLAGDATAEHGMQTTATTTTPSQHDPPAAETEAAAEASAIPALIRSPCPHLHARVVRQLLVMLGLVRVVVEQGAGLSPTHVAEEAARQTSSGVLFLSGAAQCHTLHHMLLMGHVPPLDTWRAVLSSMQGELQHCMEQRPPASSGHEQGELVSQWLQQYDDLVWALCLLQTWEEGGSGKQRKSSSRGKRKLRPSGAASLQAVMTTKEAADLAAVLNTALEQALAARQAKAAAAALAGAAGAVTITISFNTASSGVSTSRTISASNATSWPDLSAALALLALLTSHLAPHQAVQAAPALCTVGSLEGGVVALMESRLVSGKRDWYYTNYKVDEAVKAREQHMWLCLGCVGAWLHSKLSTPPQQQGTAAPAARAVAAAAAAASPAADVYAPFKALDKGSLAWFMGCLWGTLHNFHLHIPSPVVGRAALVAGRTSPRLHIALLPALIHALAYALPPAPEPWLPRYLEWILLLNHKHWSGERVQGLMQALGVMQARAVALTQQDLDAWEQLKEKQHARRVQDQALRHWQRSIPQARELEYLNGVLKAKIPPYKVEEVVGEALLAPLRAEVGSRLAAELAALGQVEQQALLGPLGIGRTDG